MTSAIAVDGSTIHFPRLTGEDPAGPVPPVSAAELEAIARAVAPGEVMAFAQRLIAVARKRAGQPRWAAINEQRLKLAQMCLSRALAEVAFAGVTRSAPVADTEAG